MKFRWWILGVSLLFGSGSFAQQLVYADPETDDTQRTNFDIVGRVGSHILVFKNNRNDNDICVYDADMKLLSRVRQTEIAGEWVDVDFITFPDFAWMVYQYERRNVVYCMAVKIDADGKRLTEPQVIDTSKIAASSPRKVYSLLVSDDKKQIMVYKINRHNTERYVFSTFLYDQGFALQNKHRIEMDMQDRNDQFSDFLLDNEGNLFFGKIQKKSMSDLVLGINILQLPRDAEQFVEVPLPLGERVVNEFLMKVDNNNKRAIFTALFRNERRGYVSALYTAYLDAHSQKLSLAPDLNFDESFLTLAHSEDGSQKAAMNDYVITQMITKKDGGYLWIAESQYTSYKNRGNPYDRFNNRYANPWMLSPYQYYYRSPYLSPYSSFYWDRYAYGADNRESVRYHADNIMVLSFNKDGRMEWNSVIPKAQVDDDYEALVSHQTMITGGAIHFLFNTLDRSAYLLQEQSVSPDGRVTRYPAIKNQRNGMQFLNRLGKQVGSRTFIVPVFYRNNLTFAKIDY